MELFKIFGTIDIKDGDAKAKLRDVDKEGQGLATRLEKVGKGATDLGKKMTKGFTVGAVGAGTASVKMAADFEGGMSEVSALSGATGSDLQMLEDIAREMGSKTKFSATEAAEGLSYMALAGWDADQMAAGLEPSLKLAGAAGMDLGTATDIVTDTMSMFQMEASEATKMTDMLAYAQANSNTDVNMLGEALVNVGANANAMGYDLADTSAILGIFADQGLKGGRAGTTLSAMLRDMKNNAEDGAISIGEHSIAIQDADGNYRDMVDIVRDVEEATKDMTQAEKDAALAMVFGDQAISGMNMVLAAGSDELAEFEEGIRNSDGAASEMYDTMNDNLKGSFEELKSAVSEAGIQIGQALIPTMEKTVAWINKWVDKFNELDSGTQATIIKIVALVAAIGPLLIVIGKISTGLAVVIPLFAGLSAPVVAAAAGIAAMVAAGGALVNHLRKDAIPEVELFGEGVSEATAEAVGAFMDMTEEANIHLKELAWGQQEVTAEMAADMQEKQGTITETLLTAIDERNEQEMTKMAEQFEQTSALTEAEQAAAMEKLNERFEKERATTEQGHERINQIIENAASEGREIRQDEADEILYIRESMNIQAVEMMSQSQLEQKTILEQMRNQSETITAKEAAEVVKNATEKKDGVIQEANEQYDETVAWAIQQRDEHGTLTAEEAARVIKEAELQRDGSVNAAEDMHNDVVAEAKAQAGEHVNEVDWETGEVLSKWGVFKNNVSTRWSEIRTDASEKWSSMLSNISRIADDIKTYPSRKAKELRSSMSATWEQAKSDALTKFNEIKSNITDPISNAKETISGYVDDIKSFFTNMKLKIPKIQLPSLPRFTLTGSFGFKPPSVPKIGIEWNAKGGIFSKPTIFNTANAGLQGVGEAGSEAIIPLNSQTLAGIGRGIAAEMDGGGGGGNIEQHITINSPKHLSPSEIARENKKMLQRLALDM